MKHSQAPWTVDTDGGFPWHVKSGEETVCRIGGSETAVVDEEVNEANAKLLIAAPELLHELGGIDDALAHGETIHIEPGSVKHAAISAAVAKAEGRG